MSSRSLIVPAVLCCTIRLSRGIFITSLMSAVDDITADHMITLYSTSIL